MLSGTPRKSVSPKCRLFYGSSLGHNTLLYRKLHENRNFQYHKQSSVQSCIILSRIHPRRIKIILFIIIQQCLQQEIPKTSSFTPLYSCLFTLYSWDHSFASPVSKGSFSIDIVYQCHRGWSFCRMVAIIKLFVVYGK